MGNPWLDVPLEDYERHMGAPAVNQLEPLSQLFARALEQAAPQSVAILGIAGGNGLEQIDPARVTLIVGVDIHPDYLEAVHARWSARLPQVELFAVDLESDPLPGAPVDLVHAALIFEHTGVDGPLDAACRLTAPGGFLSVVLQRPSDTAPAVATTGVASLQGLAARFRHIDPDEMTLRLVSRGLVFVNSQSVPLASGKALWWSLFQR